MKRRHVTIGIAIAAVAAVASLGVGLVTGEGIYLYTAAELAFVAVLALSLRGALRE